MIWGAKSIKLPDSLSFSQSGLRDRLLAMLHSHHKFLACGSCVVLRKLAEHNVFNTFIADKTKRDTEHQDEAPLLVHTCVVEMAELRPQIAVVYSHENHSIHRILCHCTTVR